MSDDISDAIVAALLKKEAADRSTRYSAFGLEAFRPDRKRTGAPKPNTRFLRNLVQETDQHNTALLAREAEDARARLEKLRRDERRSEDDRNRRRERERNRHHDRSRERYREGRDGKERQRDRSRDRDDKHASKRQRVGDVMDIDRLLQASRRSRRDGDDDKDKARKSTTARSEALDSKPRRGNRSTSRERTSRKSKNRLRSPSSSDTERSRHDKHKSRRHYRSRRSRSTSTARSRSRSRSPRKDKLRGRADTKTTRSRSPPRHRTKRKLSPPSSRDPPKSLTEPTKIPVPLDDEDPLQEYLNPYKSHRSSTPSSDSSSAEIGPSYPSSTRLFSNATKFKSNKQSSVQVRGRGAVNGASAMDARFASDYDPTLDVKPADDETDDWDMALEALRDRQKWKAQGAERLRSAGFDDDFIEAWSTNTTKDESRIKWSKDGREWDRGKVVDEDTGEVALKAAWAKST